MSIRLSAILVLILPATLFAAGPPMGAFLTAAQRARLAEQPLLVEKASFARRYGGPADIIAYYRTVLQIDRELFGQVRGSNLNTLATLGAWLLVADDLPGARQAQEEQLDVLRLLYGDADWRVSDVRLFLVALPRLQDAERRRKWKEVKELIVDRDRLLHGARFRDGLKVARRVASLVRDISGEDHPDYADALVYVASALSQLNDRASELYLLRALDIRAAANGRRHPAYAELLCHLSLVYARHGMPRRALPLVREAMPLLTTVCQGRPALLGCVNSLAGVCFALDDFHTATHLLMKAAQGLPEDLRQSPQAMGLLNNLAALCVEACRYDQARLILREVEEVAPRVIAPGNPDLIQMEMNVGGLYCRMGEYREAKRRALKVQEKVKMYFGERSADMAEVLDRLGALHHRMRARAESMGYYKQSLALFEALAGRSSPPTAGCLLAMAHLHHEMGDDAAAVPLLGRAEAIIREHQGERHLDYAACLRLRALINEKYPEYAWPLLRRVKDMRQQRFIGPHPSVAEVMRDESRLLRRMGQSGESLRLAERAAGITRSRLGETHPEHAESLRELGAARSAMGDAAGGQDLRLRAEAIERAAGMVGP